MGILDSVLGSAGKALGGNLNADSVTSIISSLGGKDGISGLVNQFTKGGLGDIISSWISTGKNIPVSANQLTDVFGKEKISDVAKKAGISPEQASSQLSGILPDIIDKLTPDGKIPEGDILSKGADLLKGLF